MTASNSEANRSSAREMVGKIASRRRILKAAGVASAALGLGGATGSAAARRSRKGRYTPGVPVIDRDDSNPDAAIVTNSLDVPIDDWTVFGDETVADQNKDEYDPDERVVIVAFEQLLDEGWPEWRRAKPDALFDGVVERGIKFHAFPKGRLQRGRPKGGGKNR